MHDSRLVGGLAALAVLLILFAAPVARAVYAAGFTEAPGPRGDGRILLVKYVDAGASASKVAVDSSGNVIVAGTVGRSVGTKQGRDDYVNGLALDARGDAYVVGASVGAGTGRDYVTIKVRASGSRAWVRRYVGPSAFDEARGVAVDPSGNAYVTGWSNAKSGVRHALTISYSAAGARRWLATVKQVRGGGGAAAVLLSRVPGARGVIISGYRYLGTPEEEDLFFAKYNASSGKLIWRRTLSNGAHSTEEPHAAAMDGNGAPVAAGMSNDDHGIHGFIAGLSPSGGDAWHSVFSSEADPGWAEFDSIAVSTGGSLLAGGWTQTALGGKAFVARYSATWPATATLDYVSPGGATSDDECRAVAIGASGMYAVEQESGERHVIELPNGSYDYRTDTPMNLLGIVVATVTATLVVAIIGVGSRLVVTRTRTRRFQPISLRL